MLLWKKRNSKAKGKYWELQETMAGISPSKNSTDIRNNGSALNFTKIQNEKNTSFHKLACHELDNILVETTSTARKHFQCLCVQAKYCSQQPQKHQEYYKSRQHEEVIFKMCVLKG